MKNNIFQNIPDSIPDEVIEIITKSESIRIERIVSDGHSSPPDFWYDQDQNEFVILLSGSADLMFKNEKVLHLTPGDYINIPAHEKHRVVSTDKKEKSVWLTVHY